MIRGRFPGALILGLLASLIAHAALFQGEHAMGGAYGGALIETAAAGCAGLVAFFASLAWAGARNAADGSILTSRLRGSLPSLPCLALTTALWFAAGERLEPAHGAALPVLTVLALLVAAWLVHHVAGGLVALLAESVFFVDRSPFAGRTPQWCRAVAPAPIARRSPSRRRRFARPPPIASLPTGI